MASIDVMFFQLFSICVWLICRCRIRGYGGLAILYVSFLLMSTTDIAMPFSKPSDSIIQTSL